MSENEEAAAACHHLSFLCADCVSFNLQLCVFFLLKQCDTMFMHAELFLDAPVLH